MTTTCPQCGAQLETSGAVQVVVCEYCNAYSLVYQGELSLAGKVAPLAELPSRLEVGRTGQLLGRPFTALGRVRYDYEDGTWDEWSLFFEDGSLGWLQDDEGELTFFSERVQLGPPGELGLDLGSVGLGATVSVEGRPVFVSELGEASLIGGQGQITSYLSVGEHFDYVDGVLDGQQAIVMATARMTVLFVGRALEAQDLTV
ncbi:MAG: DUF4178 domain-containing protein [Deltaproteobacteria bacterium]|nr:DUF4178 domain-containing protein [Deltaproteobacteria bacterium]